MLRVIIRARGTANETGPAKRRRKIERLFAWFQNSRRLVVREDTITIGCLLRAVLAAIDADFIEDPTHWRATMPPDPLSGRSRAAPCGAPGPAPRPGDPGSAAGSGHRAAPT